MESHNNQRYIQEDGAFDDLINNAGWPAPNEQPFAYPQAQDQYAQYATNPNTYDQFDLSHQTAYQPALYSNSPYSSQYQQPRPSTTLFRPTTYGLDPSLQGSTPYHGHENTFAFAPQGMENATISPQSLQYTMAANQNPTTNRTTPDALFQRPVSGLGAAFTQQPQDYSTIYRNDFQPAPVEQSHNAQIQYPTLPDVTPPEAEPSPIVKKPPVSEPTPSPARVDETKSSQYPLRITHPTLITNPRLKHAPYMSWEDTPIQATPGLKNTLPKYHPRRSRSGKDLIPGFDKSQSLIQGPVTTKRVRPPKQPKVSASKYKGTSQAARTSVIKPRDDGPSTVTKTPATPSDSSSSEEQSSSDEESESDYEEDLPRLKDVSEIRGATRPTDPAEASRWDAIGIIWKDDHSSPSPAVVTEAIDQYAAYISSLRTKLKENSTKAEAAGAKAVEVGKLAEERAILLESLYQTIDAANVLGFPTIVENLGSHHKLVNGLTTTLIECFKRDDFVGKLPKAVFSLLAKFTNMSDELLKKTRFDRIQTRWTKKGDDETKSLIAKILNNTIDAREKAAQAVKDTAPKAEKDKKPVENLSQAKPRGSEATNGPSTTAAKRPHDGDGANGKPSKKFASDVAGAPAASSKTILSKRPTNNLLGIASKPVAKAIPKKREVSPPGESKLGALLASIAKAPEPPKAPEAPARAPETPEEKARRERKESRRHLRVKFKEGPELEMIRLFKHDQDEDEGRQDGMLKDAHEHQQEGMMHKKRVSETWDDDDEDYQPMDVEVPYPEATAVDFTALPASARATGYVNRGGSLKIKTPEQEEQERREGLELLVVYTDLKDIPPSPKEPIANTFGSREMQSNTQYRHFEVGTEPWLVQRLHEIHQYGLERAFQIFVSRRDAAQPPTNSSASLQQQPPFVAQRNPVNKIDPEAFANLCRIVEQLKGKPYPPTNPPSYFSEARKAEWWEGYTRDNAGHNRAEMPSTAFQPTSTMSHQFQQQIPVPASIPIPLPPSQQPHSSNSQLPGIEQQIQGYLAGYQNSQPTIQPTQSFDYSAWVAQNATTQNDEQVYPGQNQPSRWEGDWNNESINSKVNRTQENSKGKHRGFDVKPTNESLFDERGEYKGKKKPCKFYREGKCAKGAKCTFLHDD